MKTWKIVLLCCVAAMVCGCATITPDELAAFKTKQKLVRELSNKCNESPATCCNGLAEAARALDTVVTAIED